MTTPSARRSGPDPATVRRTVRVAAVLTLLVIVYAAVSAMVEASNGRPLDPDSAAAGGTRALAQLLRARGIQLTSTADPTAAAAMTGPGSTGVTIVVAHPERVTASALDALRAAAGRGSDVVLLEPDPAVVEALRLPVVSTDGLPSATAPPACRLPEAVTAGPATLGGGSGFHVTRPGTPTVTACYPVRSTPALVVAQQPGPTSAGERPGRLVLVGSADFTTNRHLDEQGNAALAIGLLSRHQVLSWVVPRPGGADTVAVRHGLADLLPDRVVLACLQFAVAVVVLALWRGRRLGPPVPEPLPVVVRAAETTQGWGRLYAAAQAREPAAEALRAGTRARLAERLGLPTRIGPQGAARGRQDVTGGLEGIPAAARPEPDPTALVMSVAGRTGRSPVEIGSLLYGSDMTGRTPKYGRMIPARGAAIKDQELVALADQLDSVDRQVAAG